VNAPFVEEYKVPARSIIEAITGVGIGGEVRSDVGRVAGLILGRYEVRNPVAAFSLSKKGVLASAEFTGIIGGEILRRFKVIFDYPGQRMILEANANFNEPYEFDMSGLFVIAEGPALNPFKIYSIVQNSPGFDAKLHLGDVIEKIDGRPASSFTLEQVRQIFKEGEGKTHILGIRRGEKLWESKIRLRRLI
jgi:C-terminal processing protease CtpA/Prc